MVCVGRSGDCTAWIECCRTWYTLGGGNGNMLGFSSGPWWSAARTSPPAVLGAIVGAGLSDATGTVWATGMMGSGSTNDRVAGLAAWLPGKQTLNDPGLVEVGAVVVEVWARALKPCLASSMPLAVSSPIFSRSRRLVSPAAISSCRFLKALTICLKRPLETFSPNTLKYTGYLLSKCAGRRSSLDRVALPGNDAYEFLLVAVTGLNMRSASVRINRK